MVSRSSVLSLFAAFFLTCVSFGQVAVTTQHNDNYRTGQNTNETIERSYLNVLSGGNIDWPKVGPLLAAFVPT